MSYDVYGVGNAIMDIQVRCTDDFLQANGLEKGMMTLVDEAQQEKILQALEGHTVNYCSGGSAANTIVGIADMGGTTAYACKTGSDDFGTQYLEEMRHLKVNMGVAPAKIGATGTCVVLITPDAQRTMLTCLGASTTLSADDIDEAEIARAKYVYIEGYLFAGEQTKAAALKAIDLAVAHGVKVALTISDPFLIGICRDEFIRLMEGPIDLLFCNEEEAKALVGQSDAIACAKFMHQYCESVAVTLGEKGSVIMHGGEVIAIEGVAVDALDSTGAGDMYAAGVLFGITSHLSWQQSGHIASHAAARVVAQLGARLPQGFVAKDMLELLENTVEKSLSSLARQ
ncbi:MAG: adenosine kinase [Mariprofundaceae bacterium]|nr:adenosine kinase [Mariprofundaceae bacterium]